MSTLIASNLQASGATGTAALLASINGGPISGTRNRIINGDMRIDQRNAGAAVTLTSSSPYTVDRWLGNKDTSGATVTIQRSSVAPAGFTNSALITVSTGANAAGSEQNVFQQSIEGFNIADLGWGAANAQSATIGFWVRSSVTGTYGISVSNSVASRAYLATYTISAANTFEYKTVTIPGDTTGTWLADNGVGVRVRWDFGSGPSKQGSANAWSGTLSNTTSAQANVIGTTGATFYITGVQLEAGTVATPFERRSYGTELALCQRYYIAETFSYIRYGRDVASSKPSSVWVDFPVPMRATPSATASTSGSVGIQSVVLSNRSLAIAASSSAGDMAALQSYTASAEL
jgi:hypothetical protein